MPDPSPSSDPAAPAALTCPTCGRPAGPGDRFCETDGTPLGGPPAGEAEQLTCACGPGAGSDGGDGFCERCGMRLTPAVTADGPQSRDLGSATHVGRSHPVDEDAVAVARLVRDGTPLHLVVVCDGVSSSSHGEEASKAAANEAVAVLRAAAEATGPLDAAAALAAAVEAAHRAACEAPIEAVQGKDPPGTTIVAAVAHAGRVDVAWVGDSRAYLLGPPLADGSTHVAVALTHDHSWVNQVVDSGQMTEEEAMHSPWAHALLHCIGPLEDPAADRPPAASLAHMTAEPGSRLVVCSDGLWNYAPEPTDIADLLAAAPPGEEARSIAWRLVHHALAMGGHDDVTVAVALL